MKNKKCNHSAQFKAKLALAAARSFWLVDMISGLCCFRAFVISASALFFTSVLTAANWSEAALAAEANSAIFILIDSLLGYW